MKNISIALILLILPAAGMALDMSGLRAYPVPFNPRKGVTLTIDNNGSPIAGYTAEMTVYDVNGDYVYSKTVSFDTPLKWNGRSSRGDYVKPGLYLIKVIVENPDGSYGKKVLRILVKY